MMVEFEERDPALEQDQAALTKRHVQILNVLVGRLLTESESADEGGEDLNYYCRKLHDAKQTLKRAK